MRLAIPVLIAVVGVAGCRVSKNENANGQTSYSVEPAKVNVSTESTTIAVPKIQVAPDSAHDTTYKSTSTR